MLFFYCLWRMLHDIAMVLTCNLHGLHHLECMGMTFSISFLICTFKKQNVAENPTNFAGKLKEVYFYKSIKTYFSNYALQQCTLRSLVTGTLFCTSFDVLPAADRFWKINFLNMLFTLASILLICTTKKLSLDKCQIFPILEQ